MKTTLPFFGIRKAKLTLTLIAGLLVQYGFAQTNPTAQTLPYSQSFGTAAFSTLPAGIAVWTAGSQFTSQATAESSTPTGDIVITGKTAPSTTGVYGYATGGNASIYIQTGTGGNGTGQLVASINTGTNTSVIVSYQLSRISAGTRSAGVSLVYRAGTSGAWTSAGSVTTSVTSTTTATVLVAGLTASTVYQFRWVTWTGTTGGTYTGIGIDNISFQVPNTRTWIGGAAGNWNTASNWSGNAVPIDYDAVLFNTAAAVSVNADPALISNLTISGSSTVTLTASGGNRDLTLTNPLTAMDIQSGNTLVIAGSGTRSMSVDFSGTGNTASIAGTLTMNAGGAGSSFDATHSTTTVSGTINNNLSNSITSSSTDLIYSSGANYNHNIDGGAIPPATWNSGSNCNILGNSGTAPSGLAPAGGFANFIWNSTGMSAADNVSLAGGLSTINGDFTITSVGAGTLRLLNSGNGGTLTVGGNFLLASATGSFYIVGNGANNTNTSETMTVQGNFSVTAGTLVVNGAATGTSNAAVINVAGNFSHTGGTLTESASAAYTSNIFFNGNTTQTYTSGGTVSNTVNFTVNSGTTLQMGTGASPSTITGGGKFTLSDGATLGVTSPNGITSTGATGNIQTTTRAYFQTLGSTSFIYNGSSSQATGTGLPATVSVFNISNSTGVTLTNALNINGALTLITGTINASSKNLVLNTGALINGSGGSACSYVITGNGVAGTGTFTRTSIAAGSNFFPIGSSNNYLPVTINPASGTSTFSTYVFEGATQNGAANGAAITDKSGIVDAIWNVARTAGSGNADLTLQWVDGLEGANFASFVSSNIGISHFTGGSWQVAAQTTADAANNRVTNTFNSFSPFGVGAVGAPLPVILVDFNAVLNNSKTVDISWSTEQEINSSHFDVQRSNDGVNWNVIGTVKAKGNASYTSHYTFNDASAVNGIAYYRLKMVDLDGRYGYTEIKVIRLSAISQLSVFPNPAKDFVNVSVGASEGGLSIKLINLSGQVLQEKQLMSHSGTIVSLPVHNYPAGTYFIVVSGAGGEQHTTKIMILE